MDLINAAVELRWLRTEFPTWGIFHDPFAERWVAVRGQAAPVVAYSHEELRMRLLNQTAHQGAASYGSATNHDAPGYDNSASYNGSTSYDTPMRYDTPTSHGNGEGYDTGYDRTATHHGSGVLSPY